MENPAIDEFQMKLDEILSGVPDGNLLFDDDNAGDRVDSIQIINDAIEKLNELFENTDDITVELANYRIYYRCVFKATPFSNSNKKK